MLSVNGINQYYGGSHILRDVTFEVPEGSCTVILGRNGVGKTTLLKCLMGVLPVASGTITFAQKNITEMPPHRRAWSGIAYVPQGREIFSQLSVEENLKMGLAGRRDKVVDIPGSVFEMFPVLKKMLGRRGGDLSGGQQQQLAIGRALCAAPRLLILDEPTEGIQPNIVHDISEVIIRLNREQNVTVLLIEQKLAFAQRAGDHFRIMEKGRIVASGAMASLDEKIIGQYLAV
jgi:urea transport system ATP-binding protein